MTSLEPSPPEASEIRKRITEISPHLGVYAVLPTVENIAPYQSLESKNKIEETLYDLFPAPKWHHNDFQLLDHLASLRGPFIELAGPTPQGYTLVDFADIHEVTGKKIKVTNVNRDELQKEVPEAMQEALEISGILDARKLPFKKGTVGALFASGIGYFSSPQLIRQAPDVLEKDGLLVAGGFSSLDVAIALNRGLQLVQYNSYIQTWSHGYHDRLWHAAFKNPSKSRTLLPLHLKS